MRLFFLATNLLLGLTQTGWSQATSFVRVREGGILHTSTGSAAVFNDYKGMGLNFQLNFGRAYATATERPTVFFVDDLMLQLIAVKAAPYRKSTAAATLRAYITAEAAFASQAMGIPLTPRIDAVQVSPSQVGTWWGYAVPTETPGQTKQQVFLTFMQGDFIMGLGSAKLNGESLPSIRAMLLRTARALHFSALPIAEAKK
ncbi:hypothetical protein [Hymenobacter nivis]|uniref:Uncharacterized protein n=1 Tax=Hymenobacter nivis TaxID=1850093 RepID=A0A2Z3H1I5_9BACT|nr:hypothetical protein [Hymenobacter nivis]AWM34860.1 hypothetical protein DDQ68_20005 [Hymenobacter nivis]